jgi:hypothetical protein
MALAIHTPVPTLTFVAEPPVNSVAFSIKPAINSIASFVQFPINSITLSVQPFSPAVLGHDWGNHCYYQ